MNTIFLSEDEVNGFLRDFLKRIEALGDELPLLWCPVGPSGGILAQAAMSLSGNLESKIMHIAVTYDKATETVLFPQEPDPASAIRGKRVLLMDSSVHSGHTLRETYSVIEAMHPAEVSTYSLVVRAGACILPNFFGLMIGDHDRAFFLRDTLPNNRLFPCGCVRKLAEADQTRPMIACGKDFIDKLSWGDYVYEMEVDRRRQTYVYERNGQIRGFVSFRYPDSSDILVDTLAVDMSHHKQGIAGNLLRWAETCGRNRHCASVHLWAVDDRKDWYSKRGYSFCGEQLKLDGTAFHRMRKKMLYNLPDDDVLTMGM